MAIAPKNFGKNMETKILHELKRKVEGKPSGHFGYTILVTRIKYTGQGILNEDTGNAHFKVEYWSLVFRPFVNEILPAEVKQLTQQGFFCQAGPLEIFVSKRLMPEEYAYDDTSSGQPCFRAEDDGDDITITIGTMVRVKIQGLRFAADDIVCYVLQPFLFRVAFYYFLFGIRARIMIDFVIFVLQ